MGRLDGIRRWQILIGLFLISLAIGLSFGWLVRFRPRVDLLEADELEYYRIASQLLHGQVQVSARRTLGFPLAIAAIRAVDQNFLVLQIAMTSIYALSAPLLALVVRRVTGDWRPAWLSGLALALWPAAIFYGASLYSETLALPIFLSALALLPGAPDRRAWPAVAAGVVLGLATHVRPMYLLFTPFVLLVAWLEWRRLVLAVRTTALVAAGFCLVILPWSAFVTARLGELVLVSSNGGETLGGGLNPVLMTEHGESWAQVGGRTVWTGPGKWLPPAQTGYLTAEEQRLPYDRLDALMRRRAFAWIVAHPGDALYLEACKLGYMWGVRTPLRDNVRQILFGSVPTALLILAAFLLFLRRPELRDRLSRLWLLPFYVSGVALISWGSWRFRMPGDAGLIAFVVTCGWAEWQRRRSAPDGPDRQAVASRADRA